MKLVLFRMNRLLQKSEEMYEMKLILEQIHKYTVENKE